MTHTSLLLLEGSPRGELGGTLVYDYGEEVVVEEMSLPWEV